MLVLLLLLKPRLAIYSTRLCLGWCYRLHALSLLSSLHGFFFSDPLYTHTPSLRWQVHTAPAGWDRLSIQVLKLSFVHSEEFVFGKRRMFYEKNKINPAASKIFTSSQPSINIMLYDPRPVDPIPQTCLKSSVVGLGRDLLDFDSWTRRFQEFKVKKKRDRCKDRNVYSCINLVTWRWRWCCVDFPTASFRIWRRWITSRQYADRSGNDIGCIN